MPRITAENNPFWSLIISLLSHRWIRFCVVGGAATLSYYLLGLFFVPFLGMPLVFGNFMAYVLSFAISYIGQSKWTFAAKGTQEGMLSRFAIAQLAGLGLNSAIIEICASMGIIYEISMLLAIAIVPFFVYFICKIWVFRS